VSGFQCGRSYAIGVDARDAVGNRSGIAAVTVATAACSGSGVSDTVAPTTPSGLTVASVARTSVTLRWSTSTDNVGVTGYRLWRGGALLGTTTSTTVSFTGLACGTAYQFGIEAVDAAGNVSARALRTVATRSCYSWR
jgi:chitodextrinase